MAEAYAVYPHALTNVARVKNRLAITANTLDNLIGTLVNAATDFIEGETNRRFKREAITSEVHSIHSRSAEFLLTKRAPIVSIASIEYSTGIGTNKTWVTLSDTTYEVLEDGKSGMVKIYGGLPAGVNQVRISYTAGYLIDFTTYGTVATHNLPADLTDLAERLVTRFLKRREAEGKSSEGFNGSSISWQKDLDALDQQIMARYKRLPEFV